MDQGTVTAELAGGPYDGQTLELPADLETYWVGPIGAAWVTEGDFAPETVVGRDLHCYRLDGTRPDGVRVFRWVQPA